MAVFNPIEPQNGETVDADLIRKLGLPKVGEEW